MNEDLLTLLNKAYFFLKFRPRSEKEVRNYLYKKIKNKHWSQDDAEKIIQELKEEDLINDKNFIDWFVRSRTNLKPKGKRLLIRELRLKGISEELIEKYFLENEINEETLALKILSKRWPRIKDLEPKKRFEKALNYLIRRGFGYEISKTTINELL